MQFCPLARSYINFPLSGHKGGIGVATVIYDLCGTEVGCDPKALALRNWAERTLSTWAHEFRHVGRIKPLGSPSGGLHSTWSMSWPLVNPQYALCRGLMTQCLRPPAATSSARIVTYG